MIPHNLVFQADIFEVAGAIVRDVNAWSRSAKFCEHHQPTHELRDDHGTGFWREDLGVFVIPADCLVAL
jgi:hypothetical protein